MKFYLAGNLRMFGADSTVKPIDLSEREKLGLLISYADDRAPRLIKNQKKRKNKR